MAYQRDENELGALWIRDGKSGVYMTGEINGVKVVCFAAKKSSEKSPDWRVLKSVPREDKPKPQERRPSRVDNPNDNDDLGGW